MPRIAVFIKADSRYCAFGMAVQNRPEYSFSPWHSYRLFRDCLGLTPAEYIRRLRLSRSAVRLKQENCRITDVAFDLGFGSVDGYTRAFYREFGCNPGAYARHPVPIPLFIPYGAKFRELRKDDVNMKQVQSVLCRSFRSRNARQSSNGAKPQRITLLIVKKLAVMYGVC